MSRAGGRASRRKGQLVPGPRGQGAGSVLRRTEAGRGGAGPGQEQKTSLVSVSFLQHQRGSRHSCLVWGTGRPQSSRHTCHKHCRASSYLFSVLPFLPWVTSSHTDPLAFLHLCHKHVAVCIRAVIWWLGHLPLGASTTVQATRPRLLGTLRLYMWRWLPVIRFPDRWGGASLPTGLAWFCAPYFRLWSWGS